jgi:acetolactate synthase-1/2/3 large subunit
MTARDIQIGSAGESFLRLLASRGVEFFFANSGTDFPPITEALACARQEGFAVPKTLLVPHENVAVCMAHGVTMVTGRPQALMVHVNVGTANLLCGLINASRANVPMLVAAGRTPLFESGKTGSRSRPQQWAQEMFDQAGMLREVVKWDYELRAASQMESVLDRALAIACSEPQGPVYLTLPREVLAEAGIAPCSPTATQNAVAEVAPDAEAIQRAASILAGARNPLIITARSGREAEAVPLLAALAERFALPVVEFRPGYLSLPNTHPMHAGYEAAPWLETADAILVLDCDAPWVPSVKAPAANVPVIQVGNDPLFTRYPLRGFRADVGIACSPRRALEALTWALARAEIDPADIDRRRARVQAAGRARRDAIDGQVRAGRTASTMSMAWVSRALSEAIARSGAGPAIIVNEFSLVPAAMELTSPGSFFGPSPVGGLGWGLPAALGAKLAAPERLVVAAVGDGSYTFANPVACHHTAAMHGTPVLTVVMNNRGYGAVDLATRSMYPQGLAVQRGIPLVSLDPVPRYDTVVAACGGHGERVEHADALPAALDRAIRAVHEERRQALVDVICK